jgi:transposase-like protein
MTGKPLSVRQKVAILKKLWNGESITALSRRYGISRPTLYRWHYQAMAAVRAALVSGSGKPPDN